MNGRTIETGAYFGVDVEAIVERILGERLGDGGWCCEVEDGSVRSAVDTTIDVLDGLVSAAIDDHWRSHAEVRPQPPVILTWSSGGPPMRLGVLA